MKPPRLSGVIERRVLVNYRVDPETAGRSLPAPFRPHLVNGFAVAGICLIRLGAMRPQGMPAFIGLRSENAAHRFAVEWDTPEGIRRGVYIPRRDSNSLVNVATGGRLFPGAHHRATFEVTETASDLSVGFAARDGSAAASVQVGITPELTGSKLFADRAEASVFFEDGYVGFSGTHDESRFDGLALRTAAWRVEAAEIRSVYSSYFSDRSAFPSGSAELDSVLVMRGIPVIWEPLEPLSAA